MLVIKCNYFDTGMFTLTERQMVERSHGCTYQVYEDGSTWVNWAATESHPYNNADCDGWDNNCICAKD